ncbi:unnamed protein product, partial [Discosporangium mesarthrocarpum]
GGEAYLFEHGQVFATKSGSQSGRGNTVFVLQAEGNAQMPFFEREEMIGLPMADATPGVVAGLLQAVHAVGPPQQWWSPAGGTKSLDLLWAHGYHPFGPFGFGLGSGLGTLVSETARRNAVTSHAANAAATLAIAVETLNEFAWSVIPGELLLGGHRK